MKKKKFEYRESYKHLFAKNLLAKWLKNAEEGNDNCSLAQFNWRANYGVFTELKFYETSDQYYFECSEGLCDIGQMIDNDIECLDWFKKDYNRGKILFVPDITIFHKGMPKYIIEIINTHSLNDKKLDKINAFFRGAGIEVYQIHADEILRHDVSKIPNYLECDSWTL